jgi:hypothetical protein
MMQNEGGGPFKQNGHQCREILPVPAELLISACVIFAG